MIEITGFRILEILLFLVKSNVSVSISLLGWKRHSRIAFATPQLLIEVLYASDTEIRSKKFWKILTHYYENEVALKTRLLALCLASVLKNYSIFL